MTDVLAVASPALRSAGADCGCRGSWSSGPSAAPALPHRHPAVCYLPASPCPGTVCTTVGTQWAGAGAAEGRSRASGDGGARQHSHLGTSSATLLTSREYFIH